MSPLGEGGNASYQKVCVSSRRRWYELWRIPKGFLTLWCSAPPSPQGTPTMLIFKLRFARGHRVPSRERWYEPWRIPKGFLTLWCSAPPSPQGTQSMLIFKFRFARGHRLCLYSSFARGHRVSSRRRRYEPWRIPKGFLTLCLSSFDHFPSGDTVYTYIQTSLR